MNRTSAAVAVTLLAMSLTACGGNPEPVVETVTATSTVIAATTTIPATTIATTSAEGVAKHAGSSAVVGQNDPAAGEESTANADSFPPSGKYQCYGTDSFVASPEDCFPWQQQSAQPESDGCIGPASQCGYGTAPNGARNPSSGEIQAYHGCQDGYITDPALCAAAESVVREADPDGSTYH